MFHIWFSYRSSQRGVAFDYLYTGRNVDLPDPQNINGTYANFLSMRSQLDMQMAVKDVLLRTRDDFWQYTEHSTVWIDGIYRSYGEGVSREDSANQALFLFQPFEPAASSSSPSLAPVGGQRQQWLVMAKSGITMPHPYAVVFEVVRTGHVDRYKLKFACDSPFWTKEEVVKKLLIVGKMASHAAEDPDAPVGDVPRDMKSFENSAKPKQR
ncbi:Nonribosomal peptide synthetase 3 [Talaromyces pinophilus]|nr:Nonribosomal peptide synthetase 3 [Talaromyces pinophilus]